MATKTKKPSGKKASAAGAAKSSAAWEKREKNIRKAFPDLAENATHRYAGEEDESIMRRVAESTGKSYEEVVEIAG